MVLLSGSGSHVVEELPSVHAEGPPPTVTCAVMVWSSPEPRVYARAKSWLPGTPMVGSDAPDCGQVTTLALVPQFQLVGVVVTAVMVVPTGNVNVTTASGTL